MLRVRRTQAGRDGDCDGERHRTTRRTTSEWRQLAPMARTRAAGPTCCTMVPRLRQMLQDLRLVIYALGIFLCYFLFGIFQEKM